MPKSSDLASRILARNPAFGTVAYTEAMRAKPKLTALELLAKLHTPNAPGPGPGRNKAV